MTDRDQIPVFLPKLGESIHSAVIVKWLKNVGDSVRLDEPLVEVSTDKVASEIPAPKAGVLVEIVSQEGLDCEVGQLLCYIATEKKEKGSFLSPAVLALAKEKGLSLGEVQKMKGTGENGRVTKGDILAYQKEDEFCQNKIALDPIRRAIKENLTKSFREIPQASIIDEIDITHILENRSEKITLTSIWIELISQAVLAFPLLNAKLEGDHIVLHPNVNMGVAVDVEGNVMVPVIQACEKKSLVQIAKELGDLVQKAREKKIEQKDVANSTITLTNFGMTGVKMGIPIVRSGEAAILGVGAIDKKPLVCENDAIQVRSVICVSISFDHRIVDGVYVCKFMQQLKQRAKDWSGLAFSTVGDLTGGL